MAKSISIPPQVVECLNYFAPADRGMAFTAVFEYIATGAEPGQEISAAARGAFEFARRVIDPILERRRKAAERRAARKAALQALQNPDNAEAAENAVPPAEAPVAEEPVVAKKEKRRKINPEHIYEMRRVVNNVYSGRGDTEEQRDAMIRRELHSRFPGLYSDIIYDKNGYIELCPAI